MPCSSTLRRARPTARCTSFSCPYRENLIVARIAFADPQYSQTVHNVLITDSKNVTLTFKDEEGERRSRKGEGATDRARMTLWGSVVLIPNDSEDAKVAKRQYLKYHPDAVAYAPPSGFRSFRR
jgi:hypothetical protein